MQTNSRFIFRGCRN